MAGHSPLFVASFENKSIKNATIHNTAPISRRMEKNPANSFNNLIHHGVCGGSVSLFGPYWFNRYSASLVVNPWKRIKI